MDDLFPNGQLLNYNLTQNQNISNSLTPKKDVMSSNTNNNQNTSGFLNSNKFPIFPNAIMHSKPAAVQQSQSFSSGNTNALPLPLPSIPNICINKNNTNSTQASIASATYQQPTTNGTQHALPVSSSPVLPLSLPLPLPVQNVNAVQPQMQQMSNFQSNPIQNVLMQTVKQYQRVKYEIAEFYKRFNNDQSIGGIRGELQRLATLKLMAQNLEQKIVLYLYLFY